MKKKDCNMYMWYSNDTFHYMFKTEFVTLVTLKVPSGSCLPFFSVCIRIAKNKVVFLSCLSLKSEVLGERIQVLGTLFIHFLRKQLGAKSISLPNQYN